MRGNGAGPQWMQKALLMYHLHWTSRQYEEENTVEDIARLAILIDKMEKVRQMEEKKQSMKRKK